MSTPVFRSLFCRSARSLSRRQLAGPSPLLISIQTPRHQLGHSRSFFSSSQLGQRWVRHPYPPRRQYTFWERIPEDRLFYGIMGLNGLVDRLFYGIMGLNGLVFVMWYMASQKWQQQRDASAYKWMQDNFTNSWRNISSGRIWTTITSCFSHEGVGHILFNGFTYFFMARPVLSILGNKNFLLLYLGGGVAANLATLVWSNIVKGRDQSSHGASAAIYAVVSFLACSAPRMTFQLYGIIPIPAWAAVVGIFAFDTYSAVTDRRKGVDTAGHVAGLIAGAGFFLGKRFRLF